jgi:hypothetical protein
VLAGLSEWLDAYGRAWQERDAQAACDLFTDDALYQWGPFGRRLRGRVMVREALAEEFETLAAVDFGYEVLAAGDRSGIVRWWMTADEKQLEGIFRLAFDETGLCTNFKAWWNAAP